MPLTLLKNMIKHFLPLSSNKGEVTVNLNLTIKVEGNNVTVEAEDGNQKKPALLEDKIEKTIPDIENIKMIEFGERVE